MANVLNYSQEIMSQRMVGLFGEMKYNKDMKTKMCIKCKKIKALNEFVKNKNCIDGRAGICKTCSNTYVRKWKRKNSKRLSESRRKRYVETKGEEIKKRRERRKLLTPLRFRCQILRGGMIDRAKKKGIEFNKELFTTNYLMDRISKNPHCECCGKVLDMGYKKDGIQNDDSPSMDRIDSEKGYTLENTAILCWRCNKHKQDSTANELRMIADFIDGWSNEI